MQAERASRMAVGTRMEAHRATMLATASGVVHDSRPGRGVPEESYEALGFYSLSSALVRIASSESLRSLVITVRGIGAIP